MNACEYTPRRRWQIQDSIYHELPGCDMIQTVSPGMTLTSCLVQSRMVYQVSGVQLYLRFHQNRIGAIW